MTRAHDLDVGAVVRVQGLLSGTSTLRGARAVVMIDVVRASLIASTPVLDSRALRPVRLPPVRASISDRGRRPAPPARVLTAPVDRHSA
jgi:hypothetical protein